MDGYIDPKEFWAKVETPWEEYWHGETIAEKTVNLIKRSVILPHEEIQAKISAAYFWTNPKWSRCLPILFLIGPEGSGKSTLGKVSSLLRDALVVDPTSTFASIRNDLARIKYLDEEKIFESDGALFFLDNADFDVFNDQDMLNLFLSGYKKGNDIVRIASPGTGQNIEFRTFSSRVISSIHAIHSAHQFREFGRRCLPIFHSQLQKMQVDNEELRLASLIDHDTVNWEGFSDVYHDFWGDRSNCLLYTQWHSRIRPPKGFPRARYEMCKDLIATGCVIDLWESPKEAFEILWAYFDIVDHKTVGELPLEQFIRDQLIASFDDGASIPNSELMGFITAKVEAKDLLEKPRSQAVIDAMAKNGYTQNKKMWVLTT